MTARTGAHLRVEQRGSNASGVRLMGDPRRPEHSDFIVSFPGGEVILSRTTEGDYWVHVYTARPGTPGYSPESDQAGRISSARLGITGRHTGEVDVGDFDDPGLYHVSVLVARDRTP